MVRPNTLVRIFLSGLLLSPACSGTQGESEPPLVDANTYRLSVGVGLLRNVYLPRLERLTQATQELKSQAHTVQQETETNGTFDKGTLQTHWLWRSFKSLRSCTWPRRHSITRKGGEDLRDTLYSGR